MDTEINEHGDGNKWSARVAYRLRERERFLRTLISNLPGVVYRCRGDERFTSEFISDGCLELTGYTADELTGVERSATWDDLIHPADRERVRSEIRRLMKERPAPEQINAPGAAPLQFTYRLLTRDQTLKYVRDRFRFLRDARGRIVALEGFIADITEQTLADQRVRDTESRYRLLAENMQDLVCLHDREGRYLYVSPSVHYLLGLCPTELVGTAPDDLMHPADAARLRAEWTAPWSRDREGQTIEYRLRHRSGEYLWFELRSRAVDDEGGSEAGPAPHLQTVSRDITERKVAEEEKAAAQAELARLLSSEREARREAEISRHEAERANRAKDEFLQMVSHEIRTPLTTVKTLARVMQQDGDSPLERAEYLETIAHECDRVIGMIENLLDASRIEEGAVDLRYERVEVDRLLDACDKIERPAAAARGQSLHFARAAGLPCVRTDEKAARRALCAIIENAIKYTPAGGHINVAAAKINRRVAISVSDTGSGIEPADVPRIFEKFYRGRVAAATPAGERPAEDAARDETFGVGLGLYLAERLLCALGGGIEVRSAVGRGSCFTIYLPAWVGREEVVQESSATLRAVRARG